MSNYEDYIEEVEAEGLDGLSEDCIVAAADALAFVQALHTMFKDNGVDLPIEPDVSSLEDVIDGVIGELAAASIFLSEDSFKRVPNMLRVVSSSFTQNAGEEVPTVITKGFSRLADRIEATRVQGTQMKELVTN
jgi:hypothetical protein